MCSGASDSTSIFARTRGPLKIKDQTGRMTHKDVAQQTVYEESDCNFRITITRMLT
jgi:hypothetical protein